jgi:hypothetical protein
MCLLAEAVSGLPHEPPPSLLSEGNITQLLVVSAAEHYARYIHSGTCHFLIYWSYCRIRILQKSTMSPLHPWGSNHGMVGDPLYRRMKK